MLPVKAMFSVVSAVIFQQLINESFFVGLTACIACCAGSGIMLLDISHGPEVPHRWALGEGERQIHSPPFGIEGCYEWPSTVGFCREHCGV